MNRVSHETIARLDAFVELLLTWQRSLNLIGPSTIAQIWTRHVADSLQLQDFAPAAQKWVDLGSGAGFPGLVIACALAGTPAARVHLVEKSPKKAAFLREAARVLNVPALVYAARIEDFIRGFGDSVDVVTARALAPMPRLVGYVAPMVEKGAQALLLKGQDVGVELTEASKCWNIEATLVPSRTDPRGRIVVLTKATRRAKPKM
jgi:16S rRNA (guanine527-N7)-methyltransferase